MIPQNDFGKSYLIHLKLKFTQYEGATSLHAKTTKLHASIEFQINMFVRAYKLTRWLVFFVCLLLHHRRRRRFLTYK